MKSLKIYLIVAASIVVLYIVVQYNRPKPTDWSPTYVDDQKIPYGTFILYNHLPNLFLKSALAPKRMPMYNVLVDSAYQKSAYIIVSNRIEPSKPDYEQLTRYVKAGNTLFIAADYFGTLFKDSLGIETNLFNFGNKAEYITFVNPALDNERQYHVDKGAITNTFTELDSAKTTVLGVNDKGQANFIKYNMGKGALYLCANPKMFSNYSLLKPQGSQYAAYALSYLANPKQVMWDEYYTQGLEVMGSPMRVFLSNVYLRSAYYIAIFGLLIYVLYSLKRRQRIIPVIKPLKNTTVDFVNVVGQVYYERRDNLNIAHKKITYFLAQLRERYQLKTNKLDMEFAEALAQKTGMEVTATRELVNHMLYIANQTKLTDRELIDLNKRIEKFNTIPA